MAKQLTQQDYEKAASEGEGAYINREERTANPYPAKSPLFYAWQQGWDYAECNDMFKGGE